MRVLAFVNSDDFYAVEKPSMRGYAYIPNDGRYHISLRLLQDCWGDICASVPYMSDNDMMIEMEIPNKDVKELTISSDDGTKEIISTSNSSARDSIREARSGNNKLVSMDCSDIDDYVCGVYNISKAHTDIQRIYVDYLVEENRPMLHNDIYLSKKNGQMLQQGNDFEILDEEGRNTFRRWYGMHGYSFDMFASQVRDSCNARTLCTLPAVVTAQEDERIGILVKDQVFDMIGEIDNRINSFLKDMPVVTYHAVDAFPPLLGLAQKLHEESEALDKTRELMKELEPKLLEAMKL